MSLTKLSMALAAAPLLLSGEIAWGQDRVIASTVTMGPPDISDIGFPLDADTPDGWLDEDFSGPPIEIGVLLDADAYDEASVLEDRTEIEIGLDLDADHPEDLLVEDMGDAEGDIGLPLDADDQGPTFEDDDSYAERVEIGSPVETGAHMTSEFLDIR